MSDRVCAQLGVVHCMCGRSWYRNISTGMGLGVSGCISDIPSGKHSEMIRQTRSHIHQMSAVVTCRETLPLPQLLPQLPVVCWWVEFSSVEQVLHPVCVHTVTEEQSTSDHCCHDCVNYFSNTMYPAPPPFVTGY